jgi:hypothetical protein
MNQSLHRLLPIVVLVLLLIVAVTTKSCVGFLVPQCIHADRFSFYKWNHGSKCMLSELPLEPGASTVALQKERALELWKVVQSVVDIDKRVADVISTKIVNGLVPPVFHAYVALSQSLRAAERAKGSAEVSMDAAIGFRAENVDASVKQNLQSRPSANKVAAGHEMAKSGESPVVNRGFINENSFFDSDGKARFEVRDRALRESWIFSDEWTAKVCALLNADAEMVGADVEVTRVGSDYNMGKVKGTSSTYLITRRLSRGVIAECLKMPSEDTVAIVGNPGIGKSWTLIYALQQLLLQEGACVLFFSAKNKKALACIRRNNTMFVWKAATTEANSDLFECSNVWVLLDPQEAMKGSTDIVNGERRLLYAASNNKNHFANDVIKKNAEALHFLSPFDDDEIRAAVPFMTGKKFDEIVFDWASKVGNLP